MSTSQFCIQQRQQEQKRLRNLLYLGLISSIGLHGVLAITLPRQLTVNSPQVEKPMELILVDKPKPKPKPEPPKPQTLAPKPEPAPQPELEPQPEPAPQPEPKLQPEPEPQISQQPAPTPKKILTSNSPPVAKTPIVPKPPQATPSIPRDNKPPVATNFAPPIPKPEPTTSEDDRGGISCVNNCEPEYPTVLNGAEGNTSVKLTIDNNGQVIVAAIATPDSNMDVNRQALLAARQMQFSSPGAQEASVVVNINFTVEGSEFDRLAKERQQQQEKLAAERQAQEEQERQARQQQLELERERETRQQQLKQPSTTQPAIPSVPTTSKPLPSVTDTKVDDEMLRKFRERIEDHK